MWGAVEEYKDLCGLVLIMLLENLPFTHMCLASRIMSLNCHGCEKVLGFFFYPWWAPVLGLICLFLFSSFLSELLQEQCEKQWNSCWMIQVCAHFSFSLARPWEAVGLQLSCTSSINQKMRQDFYGPWHPVTKCSVRFVCRRLTSPYPGPVLSSSPFLFFKSKRLPSSGTCTFFSKSKRLPSSGTCPFFQSQKGSPHRGDGQEIF